MENENKWCFAWLAERRSATSWDRGALLRGAKWSPGDIITVSFLDGSPVLQTKVREVALKWTAPGMANLVFDFRRNTNTYIRISFKYKGSWSYIGTTCRQATDLSQPTMNYGWLNDSSSEEEIESVVLHEFGHALGLIHEHQHPAGWINWNREVVLHDLSYWSPEEIEHNVFEPYSKSETNFTAPDARSIMMYPIPKSWTIDGYSVGLNRVLSATDKAFIHNQYP